MALVGVELETLVSEPDALTTRPPPKIFIIDFALVTLTRQKWCDHLVFFTVFEKMLVFLF